MKKSELQQLIKKIVTEAINNTNTVTYGQGTPVSFDFKNYEGTDISHPGAEVAIDDLIASYQQNIIKAIPNDKTLQAQARVAIKKIWLGKLNSWKG